MAARAKSLILVAAVVACGAAQEKKPPAQRIISLVPALTEMLFAIGADHEVIAVSSYDNFPPEVKGLDRVGALLDPDTERILKLRPDLVLTYGSQTALDAQLASAGIRTFAYRHAGIAGIFDSMRRLGGESGHAAEAGRAVETIQRQLEAVRSRVRGRPRPRVLLVFGRQAQSLQQIYVSGGTGFLHELVEIAGGTNVFADVRRESVQPSRETLLVRAPDVIVEIHASRPVTAADAPRERAAWSPLASVPAVRDGRLYFLNGDYLAVPGPRIGLIAEAFAKVFH